MKETQHKELLKILDDEQKHCTVQFKDELFIVDYRSRLNELKKRGYNLQSEWCRGKCGRNHKSGPKLWWWIKTVVSEPAKIEQTALFEAKPKRFIYG